MFKELTYKSKNRVLFAAALIVCLLCWFLFFQKTVEAYRLNAALKDQLSVSRALAISRSHNSERAAAVEAAYRLFETDAAEWRNELWFHVSGRASRDGFRLIYNSDQKVGIPADSAVLVQTIRVMGKFKGLVHLLDSVEQVKGIGRISSLSLFKPETSSLVQSVAESLAMDMQFRAIARSPVH